MRPSRPKPSTSELDTTFMSHVANAADRAMAEVLEEDYLLHRYNVQPKSRTR